MISVVKILLGYFLRLDCTAPTVSVFIYLQTVVTVSR